MIHGSCHCGAVRFEAPVPERITRCNCTYCERVGGLWGYCPPDRFRLTSDPAVLLTYAPNAVQHFSCGTCGMVTHQLAPDLKAGDGSWMAGFNVRMAIDFDRSRIPLEELDGRNLW